MYGSREYEIQDIKLAAEYLLIPKEKVSGDGSFKCAEYIQVYYAKYTKDDRWTGKETHEGYTINYCTFSLLLSGDQLIVPSGIDVHIFSTSGGFTFNYDSLDDIYASKIIPELSRYTVLTRIAEN